MTPVRSKLGLLVGFCVFFVSSIAAENQNAKGFLLTGPKQVLRGTEERFCLHLQGVQSAGQVTLQFRSENQTVGTPLQQRIDPTKDDYEGCIPLVLSVPNEIEGYSLQLSLKVDWDDVNTDLVIDSTKEISINFSNQRLLLIQTDKAWYTPGQLVRFRTLTLTHLLQPVVATLKRVWIIDPSNIVVAEWTNVTSDLGLVQLELQLAAEPVQGVWKINVDDGVTIDTKDFEVKEFVLPRFEVSIVGPDLISPKAETFSFSVCAKYTFGQPVLGEVEAEVKLKQAWYWYRPIPVLVDENLQVVGEKPAKVTGKIDKDTGCYDVVFPLSKLQIDKDKAYQYSGVEITGQVSERGTEIKRNATITVSLREETDPNVVINLGIGNSNSFKYGLPHVGRGNVQVFPADRPIPNAEIRLCLKEGVKNADTSSKDRVAYPGADKCIDITADEKGEFAYSMLPSNEAIEYKIEAKYTEPTKNKTFGGYASLKPAFSPSGSFAVIAPVLSQPITCNTNLIVKVYFNNIKSGKNVRLHYFVTGRGDLLAHGIKEVSQVKTVDMELPGVLDETKSPLQVSALDLEVTVLPSFYPKAAVMVYYVREDGEVVTAQTELTVASCFPNPVTLQWDAETKYPGAAANLKIHSTPGSLCGLSVVDKSVILTKPDAQLKESTVLGQMSSYTIDSYSYPRQVTSDYEYCKKFEAKEATTDAPTTTDTTPIDTTTEEAAELTPLPLLMRPPWQIPGGPYGHWTYSSFYEDAIEAFDGAGMLVMSNWEMESRPCEKHYQEIIPVYLFSAGLPAMPGAPESIATTNGQERPPVPVAEAAIQAPVVDLRAYFPETWLWDLYTADSQGDVLIQKDLPHTITSWVGRALCVSETTGFGMSSEASIRAFQPFFLELHLPYSIKRGEKLTLKVSVYNYLASSLPVKVSVDGSDEFELVSASNSQSTCIEARDSTVVEFVIRPTALGRLNITIRGQVDPTSAQPCGTGELPTAKDALVKPLLVVPEGFPVETTFAHLVCPQDFAEDKKLSWDLTLPTDLVDGSARAWVSVVGDLMGPALDGLTDLVRLPTGCGEQNMVTFTPLIFVSDYLESSKQLDENLKKKAVSYMQSGYQRELTYRHDDGSYSAFGSRDMVGSLWLTGFVVKSFAGARKFIFVDVEDINKSVQWILSKQLENGCFPTIGTVLHKDLKGGLSSDGEELGGLTAFTLVSLLESKWDTGAAVTTNAIKCMKAQPKPNLYTEALITYALVLSKDEQAREYLDKLVEKAQQKDSNIWWEEEGKGISINIETTSYALLSLLQFQTKSDMVKASQIVRWLTKQRNGQGGFQSTQDTVMGLQALAAYATAVGVSNVDMNIKITAEKLEGTIIVQEKDKLVQKQLQVPVLPTKLEVEAEGTGCAVLQATLRYNIQTSPQKEAFSLTLTSEPIGKESTCAARRLKICAKYLLPGESNMAIVEVDMVSGYAVDKKGLQKLPTQNTKVKRTEEQDNKVVLYFDTIDEKGVCASFAVWPAFEVNDAHPANVKISDYYEQEKFVSQEYFLPTGCGLPTSPILDNEV